MPRLKHLQVENCTICEAEMSHAFVAMKGADISHLFLLAKKCFPWSSFFLAGRNREKLVPRFIPVSKPFQGSFRIKSLTILDTTNVNETIIKTKLVS